MPVPPIRDHNALINLTVGDPHPRYLDATRGDARYALSTAVLLKSANLSDLANVATARTNLGLGSAALSAASAFAPAVHSHAHNSLTGLATGDDHPQYLTQARGDARYALLGSGVTSYNGRTGDVAFSDGDFTDFFGSYPVLVNNNLSDLADIAMAQANLGLGSAAFADVSAFAPAAHSHAHSSLTGLTTGDDHTQYARLAPASSARNVVQPTSPTVIAWTFKGASGQSEDLTQWRNSANTLLGEMDPYGRFYLNPGGLSLAVPAITDATLTVAARASNLSPLVIYGMSGQSANLIDCKASNGVSIFGLGADGSIKVGSTVTGSIIFLDSYGRLWVNSGAMAGMDGSGFDASMGISSRSASLPILVIRGQSGQSGNQTEWQSSGGSAVAAITGAGKGLFSAGIGVGNSAAASTPGTVVKKVQFFDASGASIGYVPIYDGIS